MQARKVEVLIFVVLILTIVSISIWIYKSPNVLYSDACTTPPTRNIQAWLQNIKVTQATIGTDHTITLVSENPQIDLKVGNPQVLSEKLLELKIWDGSNAFSTKQVQYVAPQNLCIILVSTVQEAGQVVSVHDETQVLQSYSTEFDFKTDTYKLYLHLNPSFYKEKAKDKIDLSNVISYAVMDQLFDLTTPVEKRVVEDLATRRTGKSEFLKPFTAAENVNTTPIIQVTQLQW